MGHTSNQIMSMTKNSWTNLLGIKFVEELNDNLIENNNCKYLDLRSLLNIQYQKCLIEYARLKLNGTNFDLTNNPIIDRLMELRTLIEKLKPMNKYFTNKINNDIRNSIQEKNEKVFANFNDLSISISDDDDDDQSDTHEKSEDKNIERQKSDKYVPPKVMAVEFHNKDKKAKKSLKKMIERSETETMKKKEKRIKKKE